jgi:hypothetical protein
MSKGYVSREEPRKDWRQSHKTDFYFTSNPANAMYWESRTEADMACIMFERFNIEIPSEHGGGHVCGGFKWEESGPGRFVIFCEAPFISEHPGVTRRSNLTSWGKR